MSGLRGQVFEIKTRSSCAFCLKLCSSPTRAPDEGLEDKLSPPVVSSGVEDNFPARTTESSRERIASLKVLLRYLKVDVVDLFRFSRSALNSALTNKEGVEVEAQLCEECSRITTEFRRWYGEMEEIRMKVDKAVRAIYERMREGDEDPGRVEEYLKRRRGAEEGGGNLWFDMFCNTVADNFREETKQKCLLKMKVAVPRVTLVPKKQAASKRPMSSSSVATRKQRRPCPASRRRFHEAPLAATRIVKIVNQSTTPSKAVESQEQPLFSDIERTATVSVDAPFTAADFIDESEAETGDMGVDDNNGTAEATRVKIEVFTSPNDNTESPLVFSDEEDGFQLDSDFQLPPSVIPPPSSAGSTSHQRDDGGATSSTTEVQCDKCDSWFASKATLIRHLVCVHKSSEYNVRMFQCDLGECKYVTYRKDSIQRHRKTCRWNTAQTTE